MTPTEHKRSVAEFFDHREDYNRDNFHANVAARLVEVARPTPGARVLDIAAGTGLVTVPVARLVGEAGSVVGVDLSSGMLSHAQHSVQAAGLTNVELMLADAEALDLPPQSFDLILCGSALPYMTDTLRALRHWYTLLRPGGRIAFNSWSAESFITAVIMKEVAAWHGISIPYGALIGSPEGCKAALVDTGYVDPAVDVDLAGRYVDLEAVINGWEQMLRNPMFHPLRIINGDRLAQVHSEFLEEAERRSSERGVWDERTAYFVTARKE